MTNETKIQSKLKAYMQKKKLSLRAISRILGINHSQLHNSINHGKHPSANVLARLFTLIKDDTFEPKSESEIAEWIKLEENPPTSILQFLKNEIIPSPKEDQQKKTQKEEPPPQPKSAGPPKNEATITVSENFLEDLIVSGILEAKRHRHGGVRFVLTRESFKQFHGRLTREELRDTKALIEELRRRLGLIAQIKSENARDEYARTLAVELDELFLAYELIKEVIPTGACQRIIELRKQMEAFRIPPKKGNK